MDKRKVLLADPSPEFCRSLAERLDPSIQLEICHDGLTAQELLTSTRPDLLVIDLTLPQLDGLAVLKTASVMMPRPSCLVLLQFSSSFIDTALQGSPVDLVLMKPCNTLALSERISDLLDMPDRRSASLPQTITGILLELGLATNRGGFRQIETGVTIFQQDPSISMTKELYPQIAAICGGSAASVERSIRTSIHKAWKTKDEHIWRIFFSLGKDSTIPRPTNSQFIATLAEHLRAKQAP
ncbi:MAG: response regulator [Oscillospiraceae bacterium]|nr:response regulator [Oscillospiraceae bacterium]